MAKGTLFYHPPKASLTLLTGQRLNLPMYHQNLKIFRGVNNNITFDLKDADRQPVRLYRRQFKCVITNPYNRQLMLTKYLYNTDEGNGIYTLKLTPGDIQEWSGGFYTYSVTMIDEDGETLLYTTLDQDATGTFEVVDKPFPEFTPSFLITQDDFTQVNFNSVQQPFSSQFISSRFAGDAQKDYHDGLESFSISVEHFSGKFYVQGSLENNPRLDNDWFNISVNDHTDFIHYHDTTCINVYNFQGNYVWIRFMYYQYQMNSGRINKIWLKN